jgi:predicted RNase H-like HicB family nuclease
VRSLVYWRSFEIEVERDEEGWFVGTVLDLPGCYSQGRSEAELMARLDEAIMAALEDGGDDSSKAMFSSQPSK